MEKDKKIIIIKLLLLGDSRVGKTCLLLRYCDGEYNANLPGTMGIDFRLKSLNFEDKNYKIQIFDPSGVERNINIIKNYIKGMHAFVFIYDIGNRNTFLKMNDFFKW